MRIASVNICAALALRRSIHPDFGLRQQQQSPTAEPISFQ
jgi:hypothetical protein